MADISEEAERLTDWREHVRAAPMTALVTSVIVGAIGGHKIAEGLSQQNGVPGNRFPEARRSEHPTQPGLLRMAVSIAMPFLLKAAQRQLIDVLLHSKPANPKANETSHESI
jgi:hypothetical protein